MTDIVERLHDRLYHNEALCAEAADEIERLRAALREIRDGYDEHMDCHQIAVKALTGREPGPKRETDWDHRAVSTPLNFFEPKR